MSQVAHPYAVAVICELLGVPNPDRPAFVRWGVDRASAVTRLPDQPAIDASNRGTADFAAYFGELLDHRRRHPGDDLVSAFAAAADTPGGPPREDLLAMCLQLLSAGHLPMAGLLGNAVAALAGQSSATPVDGQSVLTAIVEEAIRYDGPVHMAPKVAAQDVTFGNAQIPAGEIVMLGLASANRDERRFRWPAEFRPDRAAAPHVGFGAGPHFCLGARLARLEARALLAECAARGVLDATVREIGWLDSFTLRVPGHLILDGVARQRYGTATRPAAGTPGPRG
jgi:cytochrome P450